MSCLTRYILRQLIVATLFVALCMTFAIWLIQSLRFIDLIVNRGLSIGTFLNLIVLLVPSYLSLVLPLSAFLAVLFVYNKLSVDSEIVVMRSSGISPMRLARPGLILGLGITAILYSITLYFLPSAYRDFKDLQFRIRNDFANVLLQEEVFTSLGKGITVFVRERTGDGALQGILISDQRNAASDVTFMAERGALVSGESGPHVIMVNGSRQERDRESGRVSVLYFDQYSVELGSVDGTLDNRWREPQERYLGELLFPASTPDDQRVRGRLIASGHNRIVSPLLAMDFVVIALTLLLLGEHSRRGKGRRLLAAVGLALPLLAASIGLQFLAARLPVLIPVMYVNVVVPMVVALWLLAHPRLRRRPGAPGPAPAAA